MKKIALGLALCVALIAAEAQASSIGFEIGDDSFVSLGDNGWRSAEAYLDPNLANFDFELAPGESRSFDFFHILCWHCKSKFDIEAGLDFATPDVVVEGSGSGRTKTKFSLFRFGWVTDGELVWETQPGLIETPLGNFSVYFEGFQGIEPGKLVTVKATVTDVTPVPLPAAAWLFGTALLGLGGMRYRQRRRPDTA